MSWIKATPAALCASLLCYGPAALAADGPTFGDKATFPNPNFDYSVSPDKKAITFIFNDLEARVNSCNTKPPPGQPGPIHPTTPVVSRVATYTLPLSASGPVKVPLHFQGYVTTNEAGQATLLLVINGQTTVLNFPKNSDKSFVETVNYSADSAAELRMTAVLLVECEHGGDSYIVVDSIDSSLDQAKQRAARRTRTSK
jgi:hypothetical protein